MKLTKITNRTIMLTVPESNDSTVNLALILGARHNFIIDTGVGPGSVKPLLEQIAGNDKPTIIINTHGDWDHIYGNYAFENGIIVAHKLSRERMDKEWDEKKAKVIERGQFMDGEVRKCLPNLVFEGSMDFPEDGISLFETPFHTVDDISVYDNVDKILHIGDNFGFADGVAYPWGKEPDAYRRTIDAYKQYDFGICMSGHSEPQMGDVIAMMEAAEKPWKEWLRESNEAN